MQQTIRAKIYGDSIMKGTVIDPGYRYHATINGYLQRLQDSFNVEADNRARFGITIEKGHKLLRQDIDAGLDCDFALVEFGGNDCNFKWDEISVDPDGKHDPLTLPANFRKNYLDMLSEIRKAGVRPVTMTLPPIDEERYLDFLTRNGNDKGRILKWLGGTARTIYNFHESYSNAVKEMAKETKTPCADVHAEFLLQPDYRKLLCVDGVHPNEEGYELIAKIFRGFLNTTLEDYRGPVTA